MISIFQGSLQIVETFREVYITTCTFLWEIYHDLSVFMFCCFICEIVKLEFPNQVTDIFAHYN